jgi:hypothetical protein
LGGFFYFSKMEQRHCLNCHEEITRKFCPNCGQKADTHRIGFVHFIAHDLLHGMFHLERGIVFTLKEALIRPGKAALDYISGKRICYYNVFYLSLVLIGLAILLYHVGAASVPIKGTDAGSQEVVDLLTNNIKMIVLGFVPLLAINARLLFWKTRLNLAEHFIVAGFTFVGVLLLTDVVLTVNAIAKITTEGVFVYWVMFVLSIFALLFPFWAYGNLAWNTHSLLGLLWRMVVMYALLFLEILLLAVLAVWMVTGETDISIN